MSEAAILPGGPRRAVRIGITGPIGCGKSTIARWLGERPGVVVIDADQVARDVLDRGEPALDAVIARFGRAFLNSDGTLDRSELGRHVFADEIALRNLEAIVHPVVRSRIHAEASRAEAAGTDAVVIEAIKLVEGGLAADCDEVWLVTCQPAMQRARLIGRGTAPHDADQRIAAQADISQRLAPAATRTIDASVSPPRLRRLVMNALDGLLTEPR